ncbi:glycine zipper 2TM domain protein [Collimonas arenae]|uniref:Glycine zipper 2TM domain protein n=1 Tax=Collimonas arenae TaxID=279058 RepID=A0A127QIH2_9BURK|nr:glycine zipper 2TM domain-containing protein [Collimonas arenae]AMP09605.1 glycine zipper 2TM domain protein [Collimonas arenae]
MKNLIAVAALVVLAGCALPPNSASVYSSSQAQGEQTVRMGVVDSVRPVTIDKNTGGGAGTLAGGALGAVAAGSTIGSGNGSLAAGVVGAVLGGIVGNQVESNLSKRPGLEITVRLSNGELRAITQDADEQFNVGDRVRLLSSRGVTRVTH